MANDIEVRFTLSGMSPDTNNYAVQWVQQGAVFNTYQMVRSTSKSVSISAQTFRCDRTYTFRVFTMRSDWTLSQGHTNQNVTPHSDTFDIAMTHPCTGSAATTTTTTLPLTCAQGGTCIVGDTGPGGGTVFYVHSDADNMFTSTGSDCGTACRYLEAAPADQSAGTNWCSDTSNPLGTTATLVGTGMSNTTSAGRTCSSGAIQIAADYSNNGKEDWYLPSLDELNQLADERETVGLALPGTYWSSTEYDSTRTYRLAIGSIAGGGFKTGSQRVRPIRAFG